MNLVALLGAGLIAAGTLATATPVEAQRYGWNGDHRGYAGYDRGHDRRWRDDRRHRGGPRWRDRGYRSHYGYRGDGYRRGRVVCRVHRSYDGPVRTCVRR